MRKTTPILPLLTLISLLTGCSTVLRLPPDALSPVPPNRAINASVSIASCSVTPTLFPGVQTREKRALPNDFYGTGWSGINLNQISLDVTKALRRSQLFLQGINSSEDTDADITMKLDLDIGCSMLSGQDSAFTLLMIVGTLDVYPFIGGPFPTATHYAEIVCELSSTNSASQKKTYRSRYDEKGWASMYTIKDKENQLAQQALTAALQDIANQIERDRVGINALARNTRLERNHSQPTSSQPKLEITNLNFDSATNLGSISYKGFENRDLAILKISEICSSKNKMHVAGEENLKTGARYNVLDEKGDGTTFTIDFEAVY